MLKNAWTKEESMKKRKPLNLHCRHDKVAIYLYFATLSMS
jgi:hypothetical protein